MNAVPVLLAHDRLGETPVWHGGRLFWIDIPAGLVHALSPPEGEVQTWDVGADVGFCLPAEGNAWVAGLGDTLARVHLHDDGRVSTDALDRPEPDRPGNRFNDGCVDAQGRLWCGTMNRDEMYSIGALYCYDGRNRHTALEGFRCPNGPALLPDGETLVFAATDGTPERPRGLYTAAITPDGRLGAPVTFAVWGSRAGRPDGMTVDAEGRVYVGVFGGAHVLVFDASGEEVDRIDVPTDNPTRPCFGGPDLRTLYVPTDAAALSDAARAAQPEAGSLFAVAGAGPGLPGYMFRF